MAIDTLRFAKRMQDAGLDQKIAEELAEAISDSSKISTQDLATKQDLQAVEKDFSNKIDVVNKDIKAVENNLRLEIKAVEERLNSRIDLAKKDTMIKLGAMMIAGFTISTTILGFLITTANH